MRKKETPPVKVAILIDGSFFIKRFNKLYNKDRSMTGEQVADCIQTMVMKHIESNDTLYRIFFYDCVPLDKKIHNPVTKNLIDLSKTPQYQFRIELFEALKKKRKVALRLSTIKDNHNWQIRSAVVKDLLNGKKTLKDLKEDDVYPDFKQKGVDMKIGVDVASLALKRFVDRIVLFSGDSDFVPAAKLARREGIDFILDPMKANVEPQLFEHIDGMKSVSPYNYRKPIKKYE